jgi:ribosome-associated translation inhibitor RaiA
MQIDPQITFRGVEPSGSVEEVVRERIGKLERLYNRITSCSVIIDAQRHGGLNRSYRVTIDLEVPGHQVVVGREAGSRHDNDDVYLALRDSFEAAQRQLEDVVRRMSGR